MPPLSDGTPVSHPVLPDSSSKGPAQSTCSTFEMQIRKTPPVSPSPGPLSGLRSPTPTYTPTPAEVAKLVDKIYALKSNCSVRRF